MSALSAKLIILDRDGVINQDSESYIKSIEEFFFIKESIDAISVLKRMGFLIAIATNQSGIARGLFTAKALDDMHDKLKRALEKKNVTLDYLAICPHGPDDGCDCRKPKPGLLREICHALNIAPEQAIFVGDSNRDYLAAKALAMPFVLVKTGKGTATLNRHPEIAAQALVFENLMDFALNTKTHLLFKNETD